MLKSIKTKSIARIMALLLIINIVFSGISNIFTKNVMAEINNEYGINLAIGKEVNVSGTETSSLTGDLAVDGDYESDDSRWSSATVTDSSPQWIYVDLKEEYVVEKINIRWQNWAYATAFKVEKSNNGQEWEEIKSITNPSGKADANKNLINTLELENQKARYIRVYITQRNQWISVSIRELEVIGYKVNEGNIALNKTVSASGIENNSSVWVPAKVVDGDKTTDDSRWASHTMPVNASDSEKQWITINFGKEVEIDSVNISWFKKAWAENAVIQISNDGKDFKDVYTITHPSADTLNLVDDVKFEKTLKANYLRVFVNKRNANAYNNVSIREIEVMGREKFLPELDLTCEQVMSTINSLGEITIDDTELTLPEVPKGFVLKVRGSEFENIVTNEGIITRHNINDATVSILLELYKESNPTETVTKNIDVVVPGKSSLYPEIYKEVTNANKVPSVIPSLQEWYGFNGNFTLTENSRIYML